MNSDRFLYFTYFPLRGVINKGVLAMPCAMNAAKPNCPERCIKMDEMHQLDAFQWAAHIFGAVNGRRYVHCT
jgi:hypothetical protein